VARQSGGQVRVESEPGRGSRFHVYFPRESGAPDPFADGEPATPARGGRETILVAENDEDVRLTTCAVLRERGYEVLSAPGGEEALRMAQGYSGEIDLLLTDVVMPRMDGATLAARIRELRPSTRALFISGCLDQHLVTLPRGAAFLAKPFRPAALAEKVRDLLDTEAIRP
jgi:CheY-like chemotaxis protein